MAAPRLDSASCMPGRAWIMTTSPPWANSVRAAATLAAHSSETPGVHASRPANRSMMRIGREYSIGPASSRQRGEAGVELVAPPGARDAARKNVREI